MLLRAALALGAAVAAVALPVLLAPEHGKVIGIVSAVLIGGSLFVISIFFDLWQKPVADMANRLVADRCQDGARGLIGAQGRIREIEGRTLVEVNGDLWAFRNEGQALHEGAVVSVVDEVDGVLLVRAQG